ncbi:hypothetical protein JL720_15363 [Aureococcus anophagefferens]|nr:hypothetical protein JL720_15363 [Aureococcus anophagefferens]
MGGLAAAPPPHHKSHAQSVARFPGPAATECFAGEVAGRAYAEGSGHALVNFSAFVTFRAEGCKVNHLTAYNGSETAPWYSGGCSLFNGVVAARPAAAWPLPQLLVGCLRGASIVPLAYGAAKVAEAHGSGFFADVLRRAAPDKRVQAEYPVYYSAHTDPGSRHMADLFLASLERNGSGPARTREAAVATAQRTMAERFGTKTTSSRRPSAPSPRAPTRPSRSSTCASSRARDRGPRRRRAGGGGG